MDPARRQEAQEHPPGAPTQICMSSWTHTGQAECQPQKGQGRTALNTQDHGRNTQCNTDKGDAEMLKGGFADLGSSVINSNGDCSQEITRRLRLKRAAMEALGKVTKSKDVSLETKAEATHTLVFPVTTYGGGSWTEQKADRKTSGSFGTCPRQVTWTARGKAGGPHANGA